MEFLTDFIWACKTVVVPLVLVMFVATLLWFFGASDGAVEAVTIIGTLGTMIVNMAYIAWLEYQKRQRP